jgi:DNA-directed RNA polymerase subunit F
MNARMPTQPYKRAKFSPESILELTTTLKARPWKLLQAEILQILNHVPNTVTELTYFLEDASLRFSEEEQARILAEIHRIMQVY